MKVLIAEDDAGLRQLLKVNLIRAGHEAVEAVNGLQAWEMLKQESIRLLIVDWIMPGIDGAELVRRIRAAGWPGYTYIILLTAKTASDDIVAGLNIGADDYLCKPFNREELLARLGVGERILDLEARLSASLAREHELASHDSLTGLLNRRALYERAQAELSRAARMKTTVSFVMLDIDHFKAVNDQYGHLVGDKALCLVAELLRQNKRNYDYAGRWGGEEFLLVLPGTTLPTAGLVAERIRQSVAAQPLPVPEQEPLFLHVSLGVACSTSSGSLLTLDLLLQQVDEAMYQAKAGGRNRVCQFEDEAQPAEEA